MTQPPPTPKPKPASTREYAVILVKDNDVLNVRKEGGANQPIISKLPYNATEIKSPKIEHLALQYASWV